jgi:hypothetical protein
MCVLGPPHLATSPASLCARRVDVLSVLLGSDDDHAA